MAQQISFVTSVTSFIGYGKIHEPGIAISYGSFTSGSVKSRQLANVASLRRSTLRRASLPSMLQNPNSDGPPSLDSFAQSSELLSSMTGAPMMIGTSRIAVAETDDNTVITEAVMSGTMQAAETAGSAIHAIHVSMPPGVSGQAVHHGVQKAIEKFEENDVCIIGRSVVKDGGGAQRIEVMVIAGGDSFQVGSATGGTDTDCAKQALTSAAEGMSGPAAFGVFVADGTLNVDEVRAGFREIAGDFPLYGGCAKGGEDASGWAMIGGNEVRDADSGPDGMVMVALFQGKLSFLLSALVKSWAQPKYLETMAFLKPSYVDDPEEDLLLAIKFDDWDKFIQCLETKHVDVNMQWSSRQNQSPLLAAVARGRLKMIEYLLQNGADVSYRNAGGYNAVMYTLRLKEYGGEFIDRQLNLLAKYGADLNDTEVIIP